MNNSRFAILITTIILFSIPTFAAQYYCPSGNNNNYFSINDVYDASQNCKSLSSIPDAYNNCLKNQKELQERYKNGKCKPIVRKTHTEGQAKCTVDVLPNSNRMIGISCINDNINFMKKVEKMYKK